ncbi:MauE/DoxX family redox-associated membrane protein [Priestia aryabhattai]|uniref:MauE/DoxX family redox-associated membrane protein n=1 Tax=Priestia aryabhattai TaxID=412384 RepID=UPI003D282BA7
MAIISLIFTTGAGFLLVISSLFKIISLRESAKSVHKITFIPEKTAILLGYLFPFFELVLAVLLVLRVNDFLVNITALIIISIFIIINSNAILKHSYAECFCFGKLLKSRMGMGGLIQSILLFLSILPNIIHNNSNVLTIFSFNEFNFEYLVLIVVSTLWTFTLILIRLSVDKLSILRA